MLRKNNIFYARLSHRWIIPIVLLIGAAIFYIVFPQTVLFYDGNFGAQRPIMTAEFVSCVVAYALVLAFLPRFYLWETLGGQRVEKTVMVRSMLALVLPEMLYVAIRLPDSEMHGGEHTIVVLGNVIVFASLALITLGSFGSIFGSVIFTGIIFFLLEMQVRDVPLEWLPLTWTGNNFGGADYVFDASWKPAWVIIAPIIALIVSWHTRLVPLHLRFRL